MHDTAIRADEQAGHWTIELPGLEIAFHRQPSGDIAVASLRTGGREWIAAETPLVTGDGQDDVGLEGTTVTVGDDGSSLTLTGTLAPSGLTLSTRWVPYPDHSTVATETHVTNGTDAPAELGALTSLYLRVPAAADAQFHVLAGGRWDEATPPRGYRLETYAMHELRRLPSVGAAEDGRSSGEYVPWFSLRGPAEGVLAALVWSGRWRLATERTGDVATVSLGISDFSHVLAPGERVVLPGVVLSGFAGDLDDAANQWRAWVTRHWTPSVPEGWPWVQYNHWYAYKGDIDAERLYDEAHHAAETGCEVFVIDDGWFLGRRPDSYHEGWGNWREDPARFPDGLRAFGERVRALGMKFGLWVEPERADADGELVRKHPDFVATRDGAPITRLPDGTGGVHLCLGNPEVQTWMAADIIRVVREYGVDWLKWDYNIGYGLGCNAPNHGHQAGDGHHAHTLGLYRVLAEIREACPDLVIENCASGGHRVDLGTLRYTHTNWLSDYTSRASSCRQHVQGAGLVLPLHHLNTWVLEERDASALRSRMGGAFGVSSFMGTWSDKEREALRQAIVDYKRLRPLLAGSRYLLSGPLHQDWEVWQLVAPGGDRFALLVFHDRSCIDEVRVRLRGIVSDRMYRIERSEGREAIEIGGEALLDVGIAIRLCAGGSEIVWGTAV